MPEPTNKNFLSPVGFRFLIQKLPTVNWFIQSVNLPGVSLGEAPMPTPFVDGAFPGEKLTYDPLTLRFKVDEDLKNWMELQNWMVGLGFPDNFGQYKDLISNKSFGENSTFSDATLIILNSNMNSNFEVVFKDAFPTSLSELAFDSTSADIDFITADVTFRYLSYTYRKFTTAT